jgi:hypothetical protein
MLFITRLFLSIIILLLLIFTTESRSKENSTSSESVVFICNELLGRPTNNSITINLCADKDLEAYAEYGTTKSSYTYQTAKTTNLKSIPFNTVINNLLPGTTYYYRVRYRIPGTTDFIARDEHSFNTARLKGATFTFAIEADPHLDYNTNPELYKLTLQNIQKALPDFLIDLGDTFMSEKLQQATQDSVTFRHLLLRSYFDQICHSIPLYLVIGNHEGELGWLLNGTAENLSVMTSNTRTKYYPNPMPDNYYSGNTKNEVFVGLRQNYYSWEWGNVLFVVLDPYWFTESRPGQTGNNWNRTLGKDQYFWFKNVLETSKTKFKFVFAHQIVGEGSTDGRGGTEAVPFYEMGGENIDRSWGFSFNRPGWELPIHQLMVKNHVNIFFHGHDHFYDKQELDGIIYQEVPQPGNPNYKTAGNAMEYGYITGKMIPSSGFLKVTVNDSTATVDYVRSYLPAAENQDRINGMTDYSYNIAANIATSTGHISTPVSFSLQQNFPNPFNPETVINYHIQGPNEVELKIFDILGREVATLVNEYKQAGIYSAVFNSERCSLSSGIYFCRITVGENSKIIKMICLK